MKKLALYFVLAVVLINCKKSGDVSTSPDYFSVDQSGRWRLKEFRESFGVPVYSWVQPIADTFYVEFKSNNVFKSNTSLFTSRTQYQILNDSMMLLSAPNTTDLPVKISHVGPYLQLDGPCFEPCNYRFIR
jgi:hypothetical protein